MRFPLRLTAELTLGVAARSLRLRSKDPLIENLAVDGATQDPASSIIWIAGSEPLDLAQTPCVVNSLVAAGRHVFLPTSGVLLRRRIHEFQPSSRLHLTIRFDGAEASHDERAGRDGAFRDALESVRTARLSGFLLCAQLILHSPTEVAALDHLYAELRKLDFDGFLISFATAWPDDVLRGSVFALRKRLLSRRWALLSGLLDTVVSPRTSVIVSASHPRDGLPRKLPAQLRSPNCEESMQPQ